MKLLLVACACFCAVAAVVHEMPISYQPPLRMRLMKEGKLAEHIAAKKNNRIVAATTSTPIIDYEDMAYMSQVTLGTPPQKFVVFLDSGSANLWVPDVTCTNGEDPLCGKYCKQVPYDSCITFCAPNCCTQSKTLAKNACASKHLFNSSLSSTYTSQSGDFTISYQTGDVSGFFGGDKFCFLNTTLCVNTQIFGQATSLGGDFGSQPEDGILGLGWPSLAVNQITPPMFNFLNQGNLDSPVFTVYMAGIGPDSSLNGGTLTVGAQDPVHCGTANFIPLTSKTFWQFKLSTVSANSYSNSPPSGWQAVSDTASSFIGGPSAIVKSLASAVGAKYLPEFESYFIDCDATSPDVIFTINGQDYHIPAKDYILAVEPSLCMFSFFGQDAGGFYPSWMLGPPLIRSYCQIHDMQNGQIGMAPVIV